MNTNLQKLTIAVVLFSTATGCSRFRELTRRDYALLRDPFLDRSAVADEDVDDRPEAKGTSGLVRIDDTVPSSQTKTAAKTVAQTNSAPSTSSKFEGVHVRGMGDSISTESGPSLSDFVDQKAEPVVATVKEEAKVADADMAEFAAFVRGRAQENGLTETAQELDTDIAEWADAAAAERESWTVRGTALDRLGAAAAAKTVQQVSNTRNAMQHPDMPTLPNLGLGDQSETNEIATPLIRKDAQVVNGAFAEPTSASKAAPEESNPFDFGGPEIRPQPTEQNKTAATSKAAPDPFASIPNPEFDAPKMDAPKVDDKWNPFSGFDEPSQTSNLPKPTLNSGATSSKPSASKLDDGFEFDSGWRPSNLEKL